LCGRLPLITSPQDKEKQNMYRAGWPPILIALLLALSACARASSSATASAPAAQAAELQVFAAASLTDAFGEIGALFEAATPGVKVTFNFAGSQQLAQQIAQGAPADLFASANQRQIDALIASGQVAPGAERTFLRNRLVVIYPKGNPAGLAALKDLANPGLKLVLADNAVPVGQYALDFLDKASELPEYTEAYSPAVLRNVVSYEENVRAVLSKVALGEADAGIVYVSDISLEAAGDVGKIDIPDYLNTIASYPIAPIQGAKNADLAKKFVDYLLAPKAQAILAKYGFTRI
jgi:molybdate transport system substrate-binding protein